MDAADPAPEDPFPVKDKMTQFVFGAPGEISFDASHGYAAFPVPVNTLVFETEAAFLGFMGDTFNAEIVTDPNTGKPYPSLAVTTYGIPYVEDASGAKLVPVDDPVETFLGGPGGYYVVEGKVRCTDPTGCDLECLPPVAQSDLISASPAAATLYTPMSAAPQGAVAQTNATLAAGAPFNAAGRYELHHTTSYGPNGATATIFTEQTAGPLPFITTMCTGWTTKEMNGVLVKVPGACSTMILNYTRLWMEQIEATSSQFEDSCAVVTVAASSARRDATNVTRFSFPILNFTQFAGTRSLSGLKSSHGGEQYASTVNRTKCWSGGCFKRDPCTP